ncbi:MAG TPA: GNAT family N-acetyltransferase [Candidatus Limnocylindrales bacterium]
MTRGASVVRRATLDDAPAIGDIHVRSWQAAYAGVVPAAVLEGLSPDRRAAYWAQELEGGAVVWVVEHERAVAGFAAVGPARDADLPPDSGEVHAIYLAPEAWDRGLGRALFAAAVEGLRASVTGLLVLWVLADNLRGRRFYEAAGWMPDGEARPIDIGGSAIEELRYRAG